MLHLLDPRYCIFVCTSTPCPSVNNVPWSLGVEYIAMHRSECLFAMHRSVCLIREPVCYACTDHAEYRSEGLFAMHRSECEPVCYAQIRVPVCYAQTRVPVCYAHADQSACSLCTDHAEHRSEGLFAMHMQVQVFFC